MGDQIVIPTGTGSEKINPLYQAATTALNNANKIAAQYGFTPTARMRLKIVADAKPKTNPAIDIINKKRLLK
jgi:P27 family predicted phage terminase small subunit